MRVHGQQRVVAAGRAHVVDQQAHAHAALGGGHQLVLQQAAGEVVAPDVVLHVQAALGHARGLGARHEGGHALAQHRGAAGVGRLAAEQRLHQAIERGGRRRHGQRRRRRALRAGGKAAPRPQRQHRQQRQHDEGDERPAKGSFQHENRLHRLSGLRRQLPKTQRVSPPRAFAESRTPAASCLPALPETRRRRWRCSPRPCRCRTWRWPQACRRRRRC